MKESLDIDLQPDDDHMFRDHYSVQLERTHSHRYKLKQLEHETKLTIEENNLLNNQVLTVLCRLRVCRRSCSRRRSRRIAL